MGIAFPTRQEALELLREYQSQESLIKHGLAVEAAMRHMARKAGEDEEKWGLLGLIHDLDYERFPQEHCRKTAEILRGRNWPEELVRGVLAHGWGLCTDIEPQSNMEKTLYAVDELTGFLAACALVRPSKSVRDLELSSARKKWKQKSFAAGANREVIERGAAMLGVDLDALITEVILALRPVAGEVGL